MSKSYDPKCGELAEHFLSRPGESIDPRKVANLAEWIQWHVELWLVGESIDGAATEPKEEK